jgi:hypothetical protein
MQLYRAGFLDRPIAQVDRFRAGGSQSLVYGLDNAGARHLKEALNVAISVANWQTRNRSYVRQSLEHTLAVSGFMTTLEIAARARPGVDIIPFEEILAAAPVATRQRRRPGGWPVEVQWLGARATVEVVPDAIFGVRAPAPEGSTTRAYIYLEVDRGTMTIAPSRQVQESDAFLYRSTILRKLLAYAESYRQDLHRTQLGIPPARVLTLTNSANRARAMQQAARSLVTEPMKLPPAMFMFGQIGQAPLASTFVDSTGAEARILR